MTRTRSLRAFLSLAAALLATASLAPAVHADEGWVIKSFHSAVVVNPDTSIDVTENIEVDFGGLQKHGIFRTIPIRYAYDSTHDRYYDFAMTSVTDGTNPVPYQASVQGVDEVIKIGDPNRLVSGPVTYVIRYSVRGVLNSFPDHDELFWNVDGNLWPVPKEFVSATVDLPGSIYKEAACYQGPPGSRETCQYGNTRNSVTYSSTRPLSSGEEMSVVVGLTKGALHVPPPLLTGRLRQFPQDAFDITPFTVIPGLLLLIAGVGLIFYYWLEHGRDREYLTRYYTNDGAADTAPDHLEPLFERDPVVVEFDPPQNLRPAQLGLILDESADTKDVTATIVDLAVRGFLTITDVPELLGRHDWLLTRKQADTSGLLPYERTLLDGLFAGREQVKISELKGTFQSTLQSAESQVYSDAMGRKFFRARPDMVRMLTIGVALAIIAVGAGLTWLLGIAFGGGLIGVGVILAGLVLAVMNKAMASRSAAGREVMQKTLGFRLYMTTAERYRQQFAEKAEIFTQLLPYAIVFGCVSRWARAFQGIDTSATNSWYVGNAPFQAALLSSSLESMNSSMSSAISASPPHSGSGSGFGGGGFSGGGGGGGGGGSW